MALSQNSKILIDDINTALSGKIDTAGTGLSKSGTTLALASVVTAGNAGPSANATLAYSGTFTVPYITYDTYGRVTGNANRTMTMPAAPSGGTATTLSNVSIYTRTNITTTDKGKSYGPAFTVTIGSKDSDGDYPATIKLPSGGTWRWFEWSGRRCRSSIGKYNYHIYCL